MYPRYRDHVVYPRYRDHVVYPRYRNHVVYLGYREPRCVPQVQGTTWCTQVQEPRGVPRTCTTWLTSYPVHHVVNPYTLRLLKAIMNINVHNGHNGRNPLPVPMDPVGNPYLR